MFEDGRVGCADISFEAAVHHPDLSPVQVESLDVFVTDTGTKVVLLQSSADGTHSRLRGETGHTVDCNIDDISTCSCGCEHARNGNAGGVVGVDVDGEVGVLLADRTDEPNCSQSRVRMQ